MSHQGLSVSVRSYSALKLTSGTSLHLWWQQSFSENLVPKSSLELEGKSVPFTARAKAGEEMAYSFCKTKKRRLMVGLGRGMEWGGVRLGSRQGHNIRVWEEIRILSQRQEGEGWAVNLPRFFSKVGKPDLLFWKQAAQCVQMMDWETDIGNQERLCKKNLGLQCTNRASRQSLMEKAS